MGKKKMDLIKINTEIDNFVNDRNWNQFHSVKNLTMALSVESSELLEIFQWMTEEQSEQAKEDPILKSKVEDELADIFVYLLRIVSKTNVNLEEAVLNKIKKNALKYPVEKAKGNSKKYDEL